MNDSLSTAVAQLRQTSDMLGVAAGRLAGCDPGATAFGADQDGRLGRLATALHTQWRTALAARVQEARAHSERLDAVGAALASAAQRYAQSDQNAAGRATASPPPGTGPATFQGSAEVC